MIAELTYRPVTDDDLLLIEVATGMIRPLSIIETEIAEARVAFEQMLTERPELRMMIAKRREARMTKELNTIPFGEYEEGLIALIDLATCPPPIRRDYENRNKVLSSGGKLCPQCDGTGNELFSSYRVCPQCDGSGAKRDVTAWLRP